MKWNEERKTTAPNSRHRRIELNMFVCKRPEKKREPTHTVATHSWHDSKSIHLCGRTLTLTVARPKQSMATENNNLNGDTIHRHRSLRQCLFSRVLSSHTHTPILLPMVAHKYTRAISIHARTLEWASEVSTGKIHSTCISAIVSCCRRLFAASIHDSQYPPHIIVSVHTSVHTKQLSMFHFSQATHSLTRTHMRTKMTLALGNSWKIYGTRE